MQFNTLTFEIQDAIGTLHINRPQALNALNADVLAELNQFFDKVPDLDIRCLIITGSGEKAFVAGADIKEFTNQPEGHGKKVAEMGQQTFQRLQELPIPSIAAVNGFALGGGFELALACDFIIASTKARFGLPEVSLGIIPGYGGTQRLARNIGIGRAKLMTLTGAMFSAQQGMEFGFVAEISEPEQLLAAATERATQIISKSQSAVQQARLAINDGVDMPLAQGLALEATLFGQAFDSDDKQEGVAAFLEKRSPKFK